MAKRKPRSRKAAPAQAAGRRIGPLWWGAGLLALGWIAFDAHRPAVERHLPQLASVRLPWDEAPAARREAAPARSTDARRVPVRPAPEAAVRHAAPAAAPVPETRTTALRPPATSVPAAVPAPAPLRGGATARPAVPAEPVPHDQAREAATGGFVTRGPTPLRRAPNAGAPVWMVLDAGRPLRVTRREGGFARVESGIFTGWVEAAVVPEDTRKRVSSQSGPSTMPTLAAADGRRAGPVPAAIVPGR